RRALEMKRGSSVLRPSSAIPAAQRLAKCETPLLRRPTGRGPAHWAVQNSATEASHPLESSPLRRRAPARWSGRRVETNPVASADPFHARSDHLPIDTVFIGSARKQE